MSETPFIAIVLMIVERERRQRTNERRVWNRGRKRKILILGLFDLPSNFEEISKYRRFLVKSRVANSNKINEVDPYMRMNEIHAHQPQTKRSLFLVLFYSHFRYSTPICQIILCVRRSVHLRSVKSSQITRQVSSYVFTVPNRTLPLRWHIIHETHAWDS